MGLDMYLYRRAYVKNWEHEAPEARTTLKVDGPKAYGVNPERVSEIEEEVIYWRKTNAIHKWFVDNVQGGRDECQHGEPFDVGKLRDLLALIDKTLETRDPRLLPTQSGFFFGETGTGPDSYYWEDLKRTQAELRELLAEHDKRDKAPMCYEFTYRYHSSW